VRESHGPDRVVRYNGYPAADINGAPAPGTSTGDAQAIMASLAAESLPKTMDFEWTELTYQQILAGNTEVYVFPLCILLVFLVLAAQFESFRLPLAVILIVPMTLLAALVGVMIKGGDNNVFTQIGLIVLIGLAAKNAILIVQFAAVKHEEGMEPAAAAVEAAKLRLRPILMTSIAFIAGVSPLVTSRGAGSEMRQAMGIAVFAGMIGVTLFGLMLTPVFYSVLMRIGVHRKARTSDGPDLPAEPAIEGPGAIRGSVRGASILLLTAGLLFSGCRSLGPEYERPKVEAAPSYRDLPADEATGAWQLAQPADAQARGEWWRMFGDPALDDFEQRALSKNQDLKAELARIEQSRAILRVAGADRLPNVTLDPSFNRTRYSPNAGLAFPIKEASDIRVPVNVSWEIDLWGRVRRSVEAANLDAQAAAANFEAVRLLLHADVAANYFRLRALDLEIGTLTRGIELRGRELEIFTARLQAGDATDLDLARAQTELATAQAELSSLARIRSQVQSSLAVLVGEGASSFQLAAQTNEALVEPPQVSAGLPAELLERRPDVARAERELAASNARIGVAEAAFFPRLFLTGFAGFESKELGNLFDADSNIWSIGPSLSLPIFQGGRNRANLELRRAAFEEGVAVYRQSVLVAFKEVQDALSDIRLLSEQNEATGRAMVAARRAAELAHTRYDSGFVGYIDVIDSERTALVVERAAAQVAGLRFAAAVSLVKALGGGWDASSLPAIAKNP